MKYLLLVVLIATPLFACQDHGEGAAHEIKQGDVISEINSLPMDSEANALEGFEQVRENPRTPVKSKLVAAPGPKAVEKQN